MSMNMKMEMEILPPSDRASRLAVPKVMRQWLEDYALQAADRADVTDGQWVIHIVNDHRMIQYHRKAMGIGTTTDVLTFNYTDESMQKHSLDLETIICVDEARRQALERSHPLEYELLLYAIHSLLHCLGYDDQTGRDALRMHRREDALLKQLGMPGVYFSVGAAAKPITAQNAGRAKTTKAAALQLHKGGRG